MHMEEVNKEAIVSGRALVDHVFLIEESICDPLVEARPSLAHFVFLLAPSRSPSFSSLWPIGNNSLAKDE